MPKPIAVLTSDVHYNLQNLEVADAAMRMAIAKANSLSVPLIVAGDLHDTKANMRAECVNAMLTTFKAANTAIFLRGNHDQIHERSSEHALNFLNSEHTWVIDKPGRFEYLSLIPYQHDPDQFREIIKTIPKERIIICHQGLKSSAAGEYIQDHSAISHQDVAGRRIIAGHYHTRQTIKLPDGGQWDYIGNPFTTSFGEANDPPKGFQILMDDGSLEFVPTNLRKHIKIEMTLEHAVSRSCEEHKDDGIEPNPHDLVWVKLTGARPDTPKELVRQVLGLAWDFRLDLIPTETVIESPTGPLPTEPIVLLEQMVNNIQDATPERKERLVKMYRNMLTGGK